MIRVPLFIALSVFVFAASSCKKEQPQPHNPYDDIVRDDTSTSDIPLDSLTITYVHKKVLSTRCALPGCHVGNFEPDFRTPQSSFSTLVYAPISKNNTAKQYRFRVVPFKTDSSVVYQRITNCCFVNNNDRMPQDNIGVPLPDSSINLVKQWILHGARDMYGNVAKLPNTEPFLQYYYALNKAFQAYSDRLDSVPYNPLLIPVNVDTFYMAVPPQDDSTPMASLIHNKLKISLDPDNFTGATELTPFYVPQGPAWVVLVKPGMFPANDTLFMRYYVNDGSHVQDTEFPRNEQIFPYKLFWSFIRK
jgi:hypothetical protein